MSQRCQVDARNLTERSVAAASATAAAVAVAVAAAAVAAAAVVDSGTFVYTISGC